MSVTAYHNQQLEAVIDSQNQAFASFKGICKRGIYDNPKTIIYKILTGKARQYQTRFEAFNSLPPTL